MSTKAERAAAEQERQDYARDLREWLPPHATIYTTAEYASDRASTAHVKMFCPIIRGDGVPVIIPMTYSAAKAMGKRLTTRGGIAHGGYGNGDEFAAVYGLGRALFPNGFDCTGKNCTSDDHSNGSPRDGVMHHTNGGYYYTQSSL